MPAVFTSPESTVMFVLLKDSIYLQMFYHNLLLLTCEHGWNQPELYMVHRGGLYSASSLESGPSSLALFRIWLIQELLFHSARQLSTPK